MERNPTNIAIGVLITYFFLLIVMPPTIQCATMTFNSAPSMSLVGEAIRPAPVYIEDGIQMSLVYGHYDIGPVQGIYGANIDTYKRFPDSNELGGGAIKFEMADGSLFNLNSLNIITNAIKIDIIYPDDPIPILIPMLPIEYSMSFSNGSNLIIDPGANMLLPLRVNNLSYFTCSVTGTFSTQYNFTIDDINVTPVPEPSTLLILGSGLVGLLGYGRKRVKK